MGACVFDTHIVLLSHILIATGIATVIATVIVIVSILLSVCLFLDLLRAQLVCELLNACGSYYMRGITRQKLNRFLVYFQRYLLSKDSIPLHVEFMVLDAFDSLEELAREVIREKDANAAKTNSKQKKSSLELESVAGNLAVCMTICMYACMYYT